MDGTRILAVLMIISLMNSVSADTYSLDITQANSWWGDIFLSFTPGQEGRKILMRQNEDNLKFTYNVQGLKETDSVTTGYAIFHKNALNKPSCKDGVDHAWILQDYDGEGGALYSWMVVDVADIWDSSRAYGLVSSNPDDGCYTSMPVQKTNQGKTGEIVVPNNDLQANGQVPGEYWVVAVYCAEDQGYLYNDRKCEGYSVYVKVVPDNFCGNDVEYKTINPNLNWDEYCYSKGKKICADVGSQYGKQCIDPCSGCEGNEEECLTSYLTTPTQLTALASINKNLCVPLKDKCSSVDDCKALSYLDPDDASKIGDLNAIGKGVTCDKTGVSNPLIKKYNELMASRDGGYGECKDGAVTARDCDQVFGDASLYKFINKDGGYQSGVSWGVNNRGECVVGLCTAPSTGCAYTVGKTSTGQVVTSVGQCLGYDLKTSQWGCTPDGRESCVGKCDYPTSPKNGWLCTSDSQCECPDGKVGKCTMTSGGYGLCASCGEQPGPEPTHYCSTNSECGFMLHSILGSCEIPSCSSTGACTIEKQDFTCKTNSDCEIGSYNGLKCDVDSGCCVQGLISKASCFDGIQNQGEKGIDCEGPCEKLCGWNGGEDICATGFESISCFFQVYEILIYIVAAMMFAGVLIIALIISVQMGWLE